MQESWRRKTQAVLNSAARTVLGVGKKIKIRELMEGCGWLYISEMDKLYTLIALWRIIRQNKPQNFYLEDDNLNQYKSSKIANCGQKLQT